MNSPEPPMPSLRRMHEIVAADPRGQAKFFLLMSELHYRYLLGIGRLHIGRLTLSASLQPCITPGTTDFQAPLEAQRRGFTYGHGKDHSILGPSMRWLRRSVDTGLTAAVTRMREQLLVTAVTVQYDAPRECGKQLGAELRAEPCTRRSNSGRAEWMAEMTRTAPSANTSR